MATPLNPLPQIVDLEEGHVDIIMKRDGPHYIDSLVALKQGTVAAPALGFGLETDTGIYQSAVGHLNIGIDGVEQVDVSSAGVSLSGFQLTTGAQNGFVLTSNTQGVGSWQTASGAVLDFADFFALMPGDNAATVAVGGDVQFPQNGPSLNGTIVRTNATTIQLSNIGFYQVTFQCSIAEAGQLMLTLNGALVANSVVGRATGTSLIVGSSIIQTTLTNSLLTVRNPPGNAAALTLTPTAGGTHSVSAHLVIVRLA